MTVKNEGNIYIWHTNRSHLPPKFGLSSPDGGITWARDLISAIWDLSTTVTTLHSHSGLVARRSSCLGCVTSLLSSTLPLRPSPSRPLISRPRPLIPSSQGRHHKFFIGWGGGGRIHRHPNAHTPKFSFSLDFGHFIWKMLKNAKNIRFKKEDTEMSQILRWSTPRFSKVRGS